MASGYPRERGRSGARPGGTTRLLIGPEPVGCWRRLRRTIHRGHRGLPPRQGHGCGASRCRPITQRLVDEAGARERVRIVAADAVNDLLAGSYDVAVMQRLIQVLSPDDVRRVLRNVGNAIVPGGAIYIYGGVLQNTRLAPFGAVIEDNITLINTTEGQMYTEQEHQDWLAGAGFEGFDIIRPTAGLACISARKPG